MSDADRQGIELENVTLTNPRSSYIQDMKAQYGTLSEDRANAFRRIHNGNDELYVYRLK